MDYFHFFLFKYPEVQKVTPGQLKLFEWEDAPRTPVSQVMFEVCPGYLEPKGLFNDDDEVNIYTETDPGPEKAPSGWVYPDLTCLGEEFTPERIDRCSMTILCETKDARNAWSELIKQGYEAAPSCPLP